MIWSRNSPDLNLIENIPTLIKEDIKKLHIKDEKILKRPLNNSGKKIPKIMNSW